MDGRDRGEEGCWPRPNHFPNKPLPSVFVSESYFGFVWPSCISVCGEISIGEEVGVLTDCSCVCPLSLCRTTCLRHHRLRGSWTPAATTRTCTRPRRKATPASITMTTTWRPDPWRPSSTTWSQMWTIIQMWVLVLYILLFFFFFIPGGFFSFSSFIKVRR